MAADAATRPKLVFFRWASDGLPEFIRLHLQQHVDCLAQFFDVTVIGQNCDYDEMCDRHQPDMVLFESGTYARERVITRTHTHPHVPKAALFNSDAYCVTRSTLVADMEQWGIDTCFAISVSLAEYFPALSERLFTWPNFVDPGLYRNYGGPKVIPVLFTGSQATHYPWRNEINRVVSRHYPALAMPHFGWFDEKQARRMIYGEQYARLINASWFAPACGTIAREVVRKHFEIPASGTCLVAEETESLRVAGFVDMQNCVFTDSSRVIDKLDYLFAHPDELQRITAAGHDLVHSRHTARNRDQIFQWYQLKRSLPAGHRIIQQSPFGPLAVVANDASVRNGHVYSGSRDRVLLAEAAQLLEQRKFAAAESRYVRVLNYHFMPEPALGLARCALWMGQPERALTSLVRPLQDTLGKHFAARPDAVEWAYFIVSHLCQGDVNEAARRAAQFADLRHSELDRVRLAVNFLSDPTKTATSVPESTADRVSVHRLPSRTFSEWKRELSEVLTRCGQGMLATKLAQLPEPAAQPTPQMERMHVAAPPATTMSPKDALPLQPEARPVPLKKRVENQLGRIFTKARRVWAAGQLRSSETMLAQLRSLMRDSTLSNVIVAGGATTVRACETVITSARQSPMAVRVFFVGRSGDYLDRLRTRWSGNSFVQVHTGTIGTLRTTSRVDSISIALLDLTERQIAADLVDVAGADVVVITATNDYAGYDAVRRMIDVGYVLAEQEFEYEGFVVLRRSGQLRDFSDSTSCVVDADLGTASKRAPFACSR